MILKSFAALGHYAFIIGAGIIGIGFIIGFHELGHFLFCKIFNIKTPTFSIGFGPKIFSKRFVETEFTLSAIPLGGFVEIAGAAEIGQGEQKEASAQGERSFVIKPYYQKLLVLCGGIIFNLLFAYLALIFLFIWGIPKTELLYPRNGNTTITHIEPNSPAMQAGLIIGDQIVAVDTIPTNASALKFMELIGPHPLAQVTLTVLRQEKEQEVSAMLGERIDPIGTKTGVLGVQFAMTSIPGTSLTQAISHGIALTHSYIVGTLRGFRALFTRQGIKTMGGPVLIIAATAKGAGQSLLIFLLILAIISINLAILNLVPLPILDGGQILFYSIEALIRRPISPKVREYIHIVSWILILCLLLYLSAQDLYRIYQVKIGSLFAKN